MEFKRPKNLEDCASLQRGDTVDVAGRKMVFHNLNEQGEPTFVYLRGGGRILHITPCKPKFRKIFGGIKDSAGESCTGYSVSIQQEKSKEYMVTYLLSDLARSSN